MCGIAGVVGDFDPLRATQTVRKMMDSLARRGPDSEGIASWGGVVLGHRRLAIFDLSDAGNQPMRSNDGRLGVVFNGSIYNYRELRQELIDRGHQFRSRTDTEVLLNGYKEWGIALLVAQLRGMFSFALWDDWRRKLYLVRDRLGVKPLAFVKLKQGIAFASTVRALRAAGLVGELDSKSVAEFLKFGFVSDQRSIYQGAEKVPAATIMEWSAQGTKQTAYWSLSIAEESSPLPFRKAVEETERLFLESVAIRLHADVPIGALLSGGIDSSLVCWAIKTLGGNIKAYTVGTPGDLWDETASATATAKTHGIDHQVVPMSALDQVEAEDLVTAYAEPFASASALGMLRVSRVVASEAKVLLTGDGGDDVFLGYPRYRHLWLTGHLSRCLPRTVKKCWEAVRGHVPRVGPLRRGAALLDYATDHLDSFFGNAHEFASTANDTLWGERLRDSLSDARQSIGIQAEEALARLLQWELKTRFVGEYLTKVDGATMHYALEARSPFLDHALWEFAATLPFGVRLHQGQLKAILRHLARTKIGMTTALRRKRGFGIPVQRWLVGRWRPAFEASFRDSILDREGWIRADIVLQELSVAAQHGSAPELMWYLFVLESWMKHERQDSLGRDSFPPEKPFSSPMSDSAQVVNRLS
jgi:asparagine synthase (glutamine-hydrolysing)